MKHGYSVKAVRAARQAELQLHHLKLCEDSSESFCSQIKTCNKCKVFVLMTCLLTRYSQLSVPGGRIQNKVVHMMHSMASRQKNLQQITFSERNLKITS